MFDHKIQHANGERETWQWWFVYDRNCMSALYTNTLSVPIQIEQIDDLYTRDAHPIWHVRMPEIESKVFMRTPLFVHKLD